MEESAAIVGRTWAGTSTPPYAGTSDERHSVIPKPSRRATRGARVRSRLRVNEERHHVADEACYRDHGCCRSKRGCWRALGQAACAATCSSAGGDEQGL